jgi:hypothetical protein
MHGSKYAALYFAVIGIFADLNFEYEYEIKFKNACELAIEWLID